MANYEFIAPISFDLASAATFVTKGRSTISLQAALFDTATAMVLYRAADDEVPVGCTEANAEGFLTHGGNVILHLDPYITTRIYVTLADTVTGLKIADGAGGARDRLYLDEC